MGKNRKRGVGSQQQNAQDMNSSTYMQYYNRLLSLAISMFEWKNLPDSIDPRFLELTLFTDGMAIFFRDEVIGELALQVMISGNLDVYRIPTGRRAYATNGYSKSLTENESVIIYNNELHTNSMLDVEMYARRLYELERTIDVNVMAQKTPLIIQCTETQRLTMLNLYEQYSGNEPFIFGDKSLDLSGVKVIQTQAPYVADKIETLKMQIWNEALTYLGISNINVDKKERLLSDEITRNMGATVAQKYTRLNPRKEACKKINKMFGLNIDVDFRQDIELIDDVMSENSSEGGEGNE